MYTAFFELNDKPFSIAPDPRYLFMSDRHREALAHLVFGIRSAGGFVLLTGEIGTGKTTVCRCLLEQLPENSRVAFVINPRVTVDELLATICDEFGINCPEIHAGTKPYIDRLNRFLLDAHAKGDNPVLIIDEAQNLDAAVLEQIRLLTNLETNRKKLLQIIMLGQPELRDKLAQPELRQLEQRITARYHLNPLNRAETAAYIRHRLHVAGCRRRLFSARAVAAVNAASKGIPRLINIICDRALLGAYTENRQLVGNRHVRQATREITGKDRPPFFALPGLARLASVAATTLFGCALIIIAVFYSLAAQQPVPEPGPAPPAPTAEKKLAAPFPAAAGTAASPRPAMAAAEKNADPPEAKQHETEPPPWPAPTATPLPAERLSWPADLTVELSQALAYQAIFKAWGLEYDYRRQPTPCQHARNNGLQCLSGKGGLETLRDLNRPAVLQMNDQSGNSRFAALTALTDSEATLAIGSTVTRLPIGEIGRHWEGTYAIFWQTPPGYQGAIRPGYPVPWPDWLEKRLARVGKRPELSRKKPLLEGELLQEVKAFQLRNNLVPDGIIGPFTLIHLNTAAGDGIPTLNAAARRN